jgi:hypothetical protein
MSISMKKTNSKHNGGGLFRKTRHHMLKKDWPEYYHLFKHTIASEKELIGSLKRYNTATQNYFSKYYKHVDNLIRLDQMFENFDSFRKSFEIVFGEFKDKKQISDQSLLLSNYNKLEPFLQPEDIIKHHLIQQIIYLLSNVYNQHERLLIKQILVQNVLKKPTISVVTSDGKSTDFIQLPQHKYHIDYERTKEIFDQAIVHMRSKLEMTQSHGDRKVIGMESVEIFPNTFPEIKFHDPSVVGNVAMIKKVEPKKLSIKKAEPKKLSIKKLSIKKPSLKKVEPKNISVKKVEPKKPSVKKQSGKKIHEIKVPMGEAILPVLKVDIPKKYEKAPLEDQPKPQYPKVQKPYVQKAKV